MAKPAKKATTGINTKQAFQHVSAAAGSSIDRKVEADEARLSEFFKPRAVEKSEIGKIYIKPGVGAMLCKDLKVINIPGVTPMESITLEQVGVRNPGSHTQDVKKANLREPMTSEEADMLVTRMQTRQTQISIDTRNPAWSRKQISRILVTNNPFLLGELASRTFGEGHVKKQGDRISYLDDADKALQMLAGEYMQAKGLKDYAEALSILNRAAGKPTLDQMNNNIGNSPYDGRAPK